MLNSSTGLFSFQFSSTDCLNSMLENGPWFIRNHPFILCKWNPDVDLLKEDVGNVSVLVGFKPQKEYRPVPKKPTANSSGNKKKGVVPTNEVSNSNPFEVLNLVNNDVEFGTNERTTNLVNNRANSSGSSFMNVENSSTNTTPITDKIKKFEDLLIGGQAILVDETGNPLKNAVSGDSYGNGDYDKDPYDDDMSEGQDLPQEIQAICDNLDIRV
ncbi:reverse transcriptase domain-containing protein [Tanacetum coccineum]